MTEAATAIPEMATATVPLHLIIAGKNPRKHFDEAEMTELVNSVRARGIIQPVVLRPVEDGKYAIVAGERRVRASREVYGENGEIPAVVREMTDDEAEDIALVENTQRADMSAAEEADAAAKILERNKGDRQEVMRLLGWDMKKLNSRLALMNLIPAVMDALTERKILLGHAELLSAAPQEKQADVLAKILEHKLSVNYVKERLMKAATDFKGAIFDLEKAGCPTCPYNSSLQNSLFTTSIGEGACTSGDCFAAKTREHIEAIKAELAEEFQTAKILEVGDKGFSPLTAEAVGEEQYAACLSCTHYGATVSAIPGADLGKVQKGVCVDLLCYQKKVAELVKAKRKAQEEAAKEKTAAAPTQPQGGEPTPAPEQRAASGSTPTAKSKAAPEKKAKAAALSAKVIEFRRKVWEAAAMKDLAANPAKARAFVLDLLLTGDGRLVNSDKLTAIYSKIAGEAYPAVEKYHSEKKVGRPDKPFGLDSEKQDKLFAAAAVSTISNKELGDKRLQGLLTFLETDLTKHFTLGENFLTLLTKSEIEAVCVAVGLDGVVADYKKIMGGKKDEAIKAILAAPFTFEGAVPPMLTY